MEHFGIKVNGFQPLTIITKCSIFHQGVSKEKVFLMFSGGIERKLTWNGLIFLITINTTPIKNSHFFPFYYENKYSQNRLKIENNEEPQ